MNPIEPHACTPFTRAAGHMPSARQWIASCLLAGAAVAAHAFPTQQVRIITPYPPGITPDIATRLVAEKLSSYWDQQVVVEARPGGNGFIALQAGAQAAPDGHTMTIVGNAHASINPHVLKSVPYNIERDFKPLSTLYQAPFFLAVATDGPYSTVKDIVDAAAADSQKIAYSTPYVGSPPHFGGAALATFSNTSMLPVHYKDGAQLYMAVANHDVAFALSTIRSFAPYVDAGKLKVIAVAGPKRIADYPDVPTVQESGGPAGLDVTTWVSLVVPSGTPDSTVQKISVDIQRALNEPDVKKRFTDAGVSTWPQSPAAVAELMRNDYTTYGELVKKINLTAE